MYFVVINNPNGFKLAPRQNFKTHREAQLYVANLDRKLEPFIVERSRLVSELRYFVATA